MRFILLLTLFSSLFASNSLLAKPIADKAKVDKINDYFMSQLMSGEFESAYSLMTAYIGVNMTQFEERGKKAAEAMKQMETSQGKPLSYALLKTQSVGEHFYKATYLLKYPAAALVWELNYYQPLKGWKLVDISFNTDINALFDSP